MLERQPGAVKELPAQAVTRPAAVAGVTHDRVANRGEVSADLVGTARFEPDPDQGVGPRRLDDLEMRACCTRAATADGASFGLAVVAAERGVDRA